MSLLFSALYATIPVYVVLYMQSVLIIISASYAIPYYIYIYSALYAKCLYHCGHELAAVPHSPITCVLSLCVLSLCVLSLCDPFADYTAQEA